MPAVLPDIPTVETQIIAMTNAYRGRQGLGAVKANANLTKAARAYAKYLADTGTFSHTADGREAGDRITSAGYQWCLFGENLALHLDSRGFEALALAEKSVEGWINSPPHRANLVAPGVTEIGVGVAQAPDEDPKYISVQLFARPQSMRVRFQVSNTTREPVAYSFGGDTHEIEPRTSVSHSSCSAGEISFDSFGGGLWPKAISMRYEARDGLVYRLEPDADGGVRVAVTPMERVR
ncbi:MAG: CAP domain-containing protein [Hyphomicrobium sp.]|uniref:CAP domain-containing protein n=1 Tax=Hyphomicrobium sp. TaxID=82 RepID=UPI003D10F3A6